MAADQKIRIEKDPDATRVYTIDWSGVVGANNILTSQWIAPASPPNPPTVVSHSFSGQSATVKVSGGEQGQDYAFVNRVSFGDGEQDDVTVIFVIRHK